MKTYIVEANYYSNGSGLTSSEAIDWLVAPMEAEEYIVASYHNGLDLRDFMRNNAADDIKITINDYDDEDPYAKITFTSEAWVSEALKDVA